MVLHNRGRTAACQRAHHDVIAGGRFGITAEHVLRGIAGFHQVDHIIARFMLIGRHETGAHRIRDLRQ
ncbi:hypothetical protein D3C81_2089320 [compost metagenome]